jgi:predicted house-cleaning noncanonical NTP pyrophosphatase (MazG superfamily)
MEQSDGKEEEGPEKPSMEKALEKLAEQILHFDEASLAHLREKYREKIEHFDGTKDWEKSVIIYCIINAVSMKNTLFNENVLKKKIAKNTGSGGKEKGRPDLKRIK